MTTDEREWIRRFRDGDPQAFDRLYHAYSERIYRFCHRLTGSAADAEDLTQEVFLAAYRGLEQFEGRSSIATWLYRIAVFRRKRPTRPRSVAVPEALADPARIGIERLLLDEAMGKLSGALRSTFLLVKGEGLSCREAAEVLGIPEGTVKYRVHVAAARLRELLSEPAPVIGREAVDEL